MKANERDRHALYNRLEEVLGAAPAETLMAHLSPVTWPDVATKQDLIDLEERLTNRFHAELADTRTELAHHMTNQTRTMIFSTLMAVFTVASLVLAIH